MSDLERQRDSARAWAVNLEQQIAAYSNLTRALARRNSAMRRERDMWKSTFQMSAVERGWTTADATFARTADAADLESRGGAS